MSADPFYVVKSKVQESVSNARSQLGSLANSSSVSESSLKSLRALLKGIEKNTNDLQETITIVETHRQKFAAIDDRELDSRKKFVNDTKNDLAKFNKQIDQLTYNSSSNNNSSSSSSVGATMTAEPKKSKKENRQELVGNTRFSGAIAREEEKASGAYVANMQSQQAELRDKQDKVLEDMSVTLQRLTGIGEDINVELEEQKQELNNLDDSMGSAQAQMDIALKKINKLLGSSQKGKIACIVVLVIVIVILFFLIVYA